MNRLDDEENLRQLEGLILHFRYARSQPGIEEHKTYLALKAAAEDLRGRQPARVADVYSQLRDAIKGAHETKSALGYETGHLRRVAEIAIGAWSTIGPALALFGEPKS